MNTSSHSLNISISVRKDKLTGLDTDRAHDMKKLLNEQQFYLLKKGDIKKAEKTREKVESITKMERKKRENDLKTTYQDHKQIIEQNFTNEKESINEKYQRRVKEILEKFKLLEVELDEKYRNEIDSYIKEFNRVNKIPEKSEIKNLQKNLDFNIKHKNYMEAKKIQQTILDLQVEEKEEQDEKYKHLNIKLKIETKKLKEKHNEDFNFHQKKMDDNLKKAKMEKEAEFNIANNRYKAKINDLDMRNKREIQAISKPGHTATSRSLMSGIRHIQTVKSYNVSASQFSVRSEK